MRSLLRWGFALLLVGVTAWIFPWLTALMALTALLVTGAERVEDWRKDRAAFDAKAIAELKAQGEENQAIRRMIHGREERLTQTRLTQTRDKL